MSDIIIPRQYQPLFKPNHTEEYRRAKFTPQYKAELRRLLMKGVELTEEQIGIKTFILRSGRISGKTVNDDLSTVPLLTEDERGDVWYCRSEENTIRRSIFQSMQAAIRSYGYSLSNGRLTDFKTSISPFEIKCNWTGNTVQFFPINKDINRTKAMIPPSGRLKKVILEEANEPDGEEYVKALRSTAIRFMDEMGKFVYRYNPPPGLQHWANRYYPECVKNGAHLIKTTWEDIAQLLDPVVIEDILAMKRNDPVHYAYWYGGEVVSLEGLVIWSFDRKKHLIPLADLQRRIVRNLHYQPVHMFYGVDSGITSDATAVSAWGIYPDAQLIKLSTFYLNIREWKRKTGERGLAHSDQIRLMAEWYKEFRARMQSWGIQIPDPSRERWCFDGAALTQDLMLEWEKATGFISNPVTNKDVERDLARLIDSYRSGQLKILDVEDNQISVQEMESFARDENNEIPEGQSDHTIDADKYATYEYFFNFL